MSENVFLDFVHIQMNMCYIVFLFMFKDKKYELLLISKITESQTWILNYNNSYKTFIKPEPFIFYKCGIYKAISFCISIQVLNVQGFF